MGAWWERWKFWQGTWRRAGGWRGQGLAVVEDVRDRIQGCRDPRACWPASSLQERIRTTSPRQAPRRGRGIALLCFSTRRAWSWLGPIHLSQRGRFPPKGSLAVVFFLLCATSRAFFGMRCPQHTIILTPSSCWCWGTEWISNPCRPLKELSSLVGLGLFIYAFFPPIQRWNKAASNSGSWVWAERAWGPGEVAKANDSGKKTASLFHSEIS